MILTKHAIDRYIERIGRQDEKEILRRANAAVEVYNDNKGVTKRKWGTIIFVILNNEIVTTITKKALTF